LHGESAKINASTENLTQSAVNKLAIILKMIFEDNQDIFLKKPEEVKVDSLKKLSDSLIPISMLFQEVIEKWFGSGLEGVDAVRLSEGFGDRIEPEITEADRLDFEQIKEIMNTMNKIDEALSSLEKIGFYLKYYGDLCKQKGLVVDANLSEIFRVFGVEEFTKILKNEVKRRKVQIKRNDLYNQAKLNTKTLKIAYTALGVSVVFAVVAVVDLVLRLIGF
jgi:hypothetical protein